jgi:Holliday junction resolvase RusA-like endonuclease
MKLIIIGIPKSKQSARFRAITSKATGKTFVTSYQKKEVVENEKNIAFDVKSQLPMGFIPFDEAIGVKILYVFPLLSSFNKKQKEIIDANGIIYKDTKPDLTDNLNKGLFDACEGILYTNDSRICKVESTKIYGTKPRIELEIYKL